MRSAHVKLWTLRRLAELEYEFETVELMYKRAVLQHESTYWAKLFGSKYRNSFKSFSDNWDLYWIDQNSEEMGVLLLRAEYNEKYGVLSMELTPKFHVSFLKFCEKEMLTG